MKKLISLLLAAVLVMGLATAAFAEEAPVPGSSPETPIETAEIPATVEVKAGSVVWFSLPASMGGYTLTITSATRATIWENSFRGAFEAWNAITNTEIVDGVEIYTVSYILQAPMGRPGPGMPSGILVGIGADSTEDVTFNVELQAPAVGSQANPLQIELGREYNAETIESENNQYTAEFTAAMGGELTLTLVSSEGGNADSCIDAMGSTCGYMSLPASAEEKTLVIPVSAGETVTIVVMGCGDPFKAAFSCTFAEAELGSYANPIIVDAAEKPFTAELAAGKYYKITGMMGAVLAIEGADAELVIHYGPAYSETYVPDEGKTALEYISEWEDEMVVTVPADSKISINMPVGHEANPAVLKNTDSAEITVEYDGFYLKWVAASKGKLSLALTGAKWVLDGWIDDALYVYDDAGNPVLDAEGNNTFVDVPTKLTVTVNGEAVEGTEFNVNAGDEVVIFVEVLPAGLYDGVYTINATVASTFTKDPDPIPETGASMMALPMILAAVSVMALAATVVCKKNAF